RHSDLQNSHALDSAHKGGDYSTRHGTGCRLWVNSYVLCSQCCGGVLWPVRCLPSTEKGLRRRRAGRSNSIPRITDDRRKIGVSYSSAASASSSKTHEDCGNL